MAKSKEEMKKLLKKLEMPAAAGAKKADAPVEDEMALLMELEPVEADAAEAEAPAGLMDLREASDDDLLKELKARGYSVDAEEETDADMQAEEDDLNLLP